MEKNFDELDEIKNLVKIKKTISFILAFIEIIIYFGFICLIAYEKEFLTKKFFGSINLGITFGIGVILLSLVLTGIYILWANKIYDSKIKIIKEKMEELKQ